MSMSGEATESKNAERLDYYLAQIANYDREALAEIYHLTSAAVFGFALSILKNMQDAEDVLHDTYLRIYAAAGGYKSMGKPMAWILTITRNLSLMKLRRRKKTVELSPEEWNLAWDKHPNITPEDRIVLMACLEKLSAEERQIVILHSVSGFKHREVAEFLSLPLSTVLSKYHRAIKKMRVLLTEGGVT
ncbi:MAG: RNA polymerase sigma factor [Thermoanaerobacteraceae bacterium]|nr:RNA polymerase sigma factor [Thermoanaerobacteraceae bacterium]